MKIVVLDGYVLNPGDLSWDGFFALGEVTLYERTSMEEVAARIGAAEAAITNKAFITREVMESCPNLRYIGVLATGYNVVDVAAAQERGIVVTNIPTYGTTAVAQFVFALLLEVCHHVQAHSDLVHTGEWSSNQDWTFWRYPLIELAGKTMGIIGFGRIGQNTARIASAYGMRVLAYDKHPGPDAHRFGELVSLDRLLTEADVISLHCPLFADTEGMINKDRIRKMKDGVIIINTSRGPLVVERDLADALNQGKVYAAGLDVVSTEPISLDNPLLKAKNCIMTPHIAWAPKESRARLMDIAVENLSKFVAGTPTNVIRL